jgi:hypothetical protein
MRKMWMALGVLALLGGTAAAQDEGAYRAREAEAAPANTQEVMVHRYVFNGAGRTPEQMAAERCGGGHVATTHVHRTAGDVAAMVFSAFWYTPAHVTVECSRSTAVR